MKKAWTKKIFRSTWLAASLLIGGASVAHAATTWKMHMVWVPTRVEAQYYQKFVDRVNEQVGDELKITLYPGASLGVNDVDMLRILPRGNVIQAAGLYPGYMTRDEPHYAVTLPPGVVSEPESLPDLVPVLNDIYGKTYDKWGIKLLGYVAHPVRDTQLICKEPIHSLGDLKGKKVRVWEKAQADTFQRLGIAAQIIGQNDLYMAMRTGVVDCAIYPTHFSLTVSLQEAAPYASYLFPYVLHPLNLIVSKSAFDKLSPEVQKVLMDTAQEIQNESFEAYVNGDVDKLSEEQWKAAGGTVLEAFSEADQKAFAEAARAVWKESAEQMGGVAAENYNAVNAVVGN